jgi:tRNA wybutosine-synthesizing protein 1
MFFKINGPKRKDAWERWQKSLEFLSDAKTRTVLRFTLIRNFNNESRFHDNFKKIIETGQPHFVELKSYMHIGMSTNRLEHSNMLEMQEVRNFTKGLVSKLSDYITMDESVVSRIVVLQNKKRFVSRWIEEYS